MDVGQLGQLGYFFACAVEDQVSLWQTDEQVKVVYNCSTSE